MEDPPKPNPSEPAEGWDERDTFNPTIVGGRPLGRREAGHGIPRGIEVLIRKAAVDRGFRTLLLEKRVRAAAEIGLELSAAEAAMLTSIPRKQIETIIENTTVPDEQRRAFLGKVSAAMLAVLGAGLTGCDVKNPWRYQHDELFEPTIIPITFGIRPEEGWIRRLLRKNPVAIRIPSIDEAIRVDIVEQGPNVVIALVKCTCPFGGAEVAVFFRSDVKTKRPVIRCEPRASILHRGKNWIKICAQGRGGTTHWLIIRLTNFSRQTEARSVLAEFFKSPLDDSRVGEYASPDVVRFKIVKYRKEWPTA